MADNKKSKLEHMDSMFAYGPETKETAGLSDTRKAAMVLFYSDFVPVTCSRLRSQLVRKQMETNIQNIKPML